MTFVAIIALFAAGPTPPPADDLDRAEALCEQFKYADARPLLLKVRATPGLSRDKVLRVLMLQGVAAGQLRQSLAAVAAFKELLVLAPETVLDADYAPRVTTPFLEAKAWVGAGKRPEASERLAGQTVTGLVVVSDDKLGLSRWVRFTVEGKVTKWPLVEGRAVLELTPTSSVQWSAEVLGVHDEVLFVIASREWHAPVVPVATSLPPPPPPPPPSSVGQPAPAPSLGPMRVGALMVGGAAVVGVAVGAVFGVQSEAAFSTITQATKQGGVITGITEQRAYALNAQGKSLALVANGLFIGAGALAVTAGLLWLFGAPPPRLALVPDGAGFSLVGVWP
jgi:hypothetical protein